jgi:hypothetical protein
MATILENLSSALLITLIVILAYILYKRLLGALQKDRLSAKYFSIEAFHIVGDHPAVQAEITIKMTQPDRISITLNRDNTNSVEPIFSKELAIGIHRLMIDLERSDDGGAKQKIEVLSSSQTWVKNL